jgi:outer membrane immunogenic protein
VTILPQLRKIGVIPFCRIPFCRIADRELRLHLTVFCCPGGENAMRRLAIVLFAGAGVALGIAGVASAADLGRPVKAPPPPAAIVADDWSGFYVGGNLGGAFSRSSYTFDNGLGSVESFSFDANTMMAGGHAGVQGQWGAFVLGIEGSFDATDLTRTAVGLNSTQTLKLDDIATATGRLGYALPAWLFYVKGGWAVVHENDSSVDAQSATHSFAEWKSGFTVGGGVEHKWTPNWVIGAEFNFYNAKFDHTGADSSGTTVHVANGNADIYSVLFRASYMFK